MARKVSRSSSARQANRNKTSTNWLWPIVIVSFVAMLLLFTCSRNENKERNTARSRSTNKESARIPASQGASRTITMRKGDDGLYYMPARINGQELEFIFDTGCSGLSLSSVEAQLLMKQGKLSEEDFIQESYAIIADGSKSPIYIVNLKSVEVAGVTLNNVQASISPNQTAPILLGQSVMSRFGSFTMNYNNNTVTFR